MSSYLVVGSFYLGYVIIVCLVYFWTKYTINSESIKLPSKEVVIWRLGHLDVKVEWLILDNLCNEIAMKAGCIFKPDELIIYIENCVKQISIESSENPLITSNTQLQIIEKLVDNKGFVRKVRKLYKNN